MTNRDKTVNQGKALPGEGENRLRGGAAAHSPKTHRDSPGSRRRERHARNSLAILRKTRPVESGHEGRMALTNSAAVFGQELFGSPSETKYELPKREKKRKFFIYNHRSENTLDLDVLLPHGWRWSYLAKPTCACRCELA